MGVWYLPLAVAILLDVVLAFTEGVPELDGLVTRSRDDLPVISTEADGQDVRSVANESAGGLAGVEVPEAESVIPGSREGELAVGRDNDIRDEVVVAVEDALGVPIALIIAGQLPDDDGLVYSAGKRG
jgi:hypothetical protein